MIVHFVNFVYNNFMKTILYDLFDIIKTVLIVLVIFFASRYFLVQPFVVEGHSMDPNFSDQEYLLVNRLSYRISTPKRGDVVVFKAPSNPQYDYIKRVIGLPGETVVIKDNHIYVNGQIIQEDYLAADTQTLIKNSKTATLEITLNNDEYFVLGDNREHSSDSREWGVLPKNMIIGKAWLSIYPWKTFGFIPSVSYI